MPAYYHTPPACATLRPARLRARASELSRFRVGQTPPPPPSAQLRASSPRSAFASRASPSARSKSGGGPPATPDHLRPWAASLTRSGRSGAALTVGPSGPSGARGGGPGGRRPAAAPGSPPAPFSDFLSAGIRLPRSRPAPARPLPPEPPPARGAGKGGIPHSQFSLSVPFLVRSERSRRRLVGGAAAGRRLAPVGPLVGPASGSVFPLGSSLKFEERRG